MLGFLNTTHKPPIKNILNFFFVIPRVLTIYYVIYIAFLSNRPQQQQQ